MVAESAKAVVRRVARLSTAALAALTVLVAFAPQPPPDPVAAFAGRVSFRVFDAGWCNAGDLGDVLLTAAHCLVGPVLTLGFPAADVHAEGKSGTAEVACRSDLPESAWIVRMHEGRVRILPVRLRREGELVVTRDARSRPGWSGSPVVDDDGRVVAVVIGRRGSDGATVVSDPEITCIAVSRARSA